LLGAGWALFTRVRGSPKGSQSGCGLSCEASSASLLREQVFHLRFMTDTREMKFEDVVKAAEQVTVLVLVY
jgi:hypothetical protein